jgi:hypothetical protein
MASLAHQVEGIVTKRDFVEFAASLYEVYARHREEWEWDNDTLDTYLEALAAWVNDMDGFFLNSGEVPPEQPTWKLIGRILLAATHYE